MKDTYHKRWDIPEGRLALRGGYQSSHNDTSWKIYGVYSARLTDEECLDDFPIQPETSNAGQIFHWAPALRRSRTRVLVYQYGGVDC